MAEENKGKRYFLCIQERRGYCFDKWEYIHNLYTEQELIDRGVEYVVSTMPSGVEYVVSTMPSGVFEPDGTTTEIKRYASVEEFKQMNPDCCKLTRFINEGIDGYPDDDGYGYDGYPDDDGYGYIRIEYLRHYVGNFKPDHRVLYLEYTPCGELREEVSF
ncbi:hypothetical protein Pmu3358_05055 [Pasteurella multocida]|nr:hypothetical protein Pmu3358_05055 [Pasteurella multocida]